MINVMIIDDHPIVREGLETMLSNRSRFNVVAVMSGGEDALEWCRRNSLPDVILCDVMMAKMDGFATLSAFRKEFPAAKMLLLTGLPKSGDEELARSLGAAGYMSKATDTNDLCDTIARIAGGLVNFASEEYASSETPLSPKETETLRYFALGKTRDEIAIIQGCSPETVKTRSVEIRRKLDASNIAAAIARAYELGYLRA